MNKISIYLNIFVAILLLFTLASCARFPSGGGPVTPPDKTLHITATMLGPMQPGYYYYLALGLDQNNTSGPVPVVSLGSTNWGTISNSPVPKLPPYYVVCMNASGDNLGVAYVVNGEQNIGTPYIYKQYREYNSAASSYNYVIEFEIDLAPIETLIESQPGYDLNKPKIIQANFITRENIDPTSKYDSFGINPYQNNTGYVTINLNGSNSPIRGDTTGSLSGNYEAAYNDSNSFGQKELTTDLPGLDIIKWQMEIKKYN